MRPVWPKIRTKGYDKKPYKPNKTFRLNYFNLKPMLVPCGKCAFCLTNRRSQWMFRIYHEMRTQRHAGYFLTLTYDERHVPRADTGLLSLRFRDIQLYLKRLRKEKYYAKYICVGEYGSVTQRPHYHMLLWTDAPTEFLQSNWKSSKDGSVMGNVHFGVLSMASAMYTLKYIIQPKVKSVPGIEDTRAQFSRGLGLCYLSEEVYNYHTENYDDPAFFSYIDGNKVALPRYIKSKIFTKYQMRQQNELTREKFIADRALAMRQALALGDALGKRQTLLQRFAAARAYLRSLRVEESDRILKTTKYNQTL